MFPTNAKAGCGTDRRSHRWRCWRCRRRTRRTPSRRPEAKKAAAAKQKTYATPEEAVKDLVAAVKARRSRRRCSPILGPEAKPIASSGDKVADTEGGERFVKAYEEANKLEKSGDAKAVLSIGKDDWPFPIPIVKDAAGWRFDTKAGQEEILNRRIGRNELSTMQAVLAYVDAQREYYLRNPQNDKLLQLRAEVHEHARASATGSTSRRRRASRRARSGRCSTAPRPHGYAKGEDGKPGAYHGYHYRILKAQGPDAPGGAYDYVAQGRMIGGHALVAWPATYGNSGVMTFIVNHDGVVYEKDLGPETRRRGAEDHEVQPGQDLAQGGEEMTARAACFEGRGYSVK